MGVECRYSRWMEIIPSFHSKSQRPSSWPWLLRKAASPRSQHSPYLSPLKPKGPVRAISARYWGWGTWQSDYVVPANPSVALVVSFDGLLCVGRVSPLVFAAVV